MENYCLLRLFFILVDSLHLLRINEFILNQSQKKTCTNNAKCADNDYKLSYHIKRKTYDAKSEWEICTTRWDQMKEGKTTMENEEVEEAEKESAKERIRKDDDKKKSGNEKSATSSSNMVWW